MKEIQNVFDILKAFIHSPHGLVKNIFDKFFFLQNNFPSIKVLFHIEFKQFFHQDFPPIIFKDPNEVNYIKE